MKNLFQIAIVQQDLRCVELLLKFIQLSFQAACSGGHQIIGMGEVSYA